ncbi:SAM-dependent methyltransferase [Caballeronia megalochromosomata]|nr:SAM-dependent methyltransferase [Caballeronia megalochromosomata]
MNQPAAGSGDSPQPDSAVRRRAPAAERNRDAILSVLARVLPQSGVVLEIASGTGQHAVHCAAALPGIVWQPSDPDADARDSIAAWRAQAGLANLNAPLALDVLSDDWGIGDVAAIVCINMIHIAPWEAAESLFRGAGARLGAGGVLYLYGPYRRNGAHTAPSNEAFDQQLRARDPRWGVRDLEAVEALGEQAGLTLVETVAMPANNFSVVFEKRA